MIKNAKPKVGIISLGCPRNLVDSEIILGNLKNQGYQISDIQDADIAIVNTCCFIKEAKEESIETILELADLKAQGRIKKLIVSGCLPQRYRKELIPHLKEVDAFVGRLSLDNFPKERYNLVPKHFAYLKISEGCNNHCSYCVIPKIKGKFRSRPIEDILKEIRLLDKNKVKEINIIGQDITSYGMDIYKKPSLAKLLKKIVSSTKNVKWIRLLYTYPTNIDDELIELIASNKKICKYLDLPIQHINNRILKLMNRRISKEQIVDLIKRLRIKVPGIAIRTSLIVGFPSETEKEFQELLDFVSITKFERLGVFMYSREEGTPAYNFKNQIPQKVKEERLHKIMSMQQAIAREINSKFLNKEIYVLIDEIGEEPGLFLGRTESDAPEVDGMVYVHSKNKVKPGDLVKVKIKDTYEYDLVGEKI
ncbi:MAG: 30S ribosomal protein S12 methylthiotransferase RimO [Candidatus Omnitrophica bacterium]|nr:30S ribosomal protein S12 methylthiotransferase RimO [Candidatus Omnitrophota bacterium]HOX54384.1 30S ribosomal protein S12 methylthiotransferase RimO [Candidatus Omnitrophota bacterium]